MRHGSMLHVPRELDSWRWEGNRHPASTDAEPILPSSLPRSMRSMFSDWLSARWPTVGREPG